MIFDDVARVVVNFLI